MELFVKVQDNWRQNPTVVRQLDWHRQLEDLAERQSPDDAEGESAAPAATSAASDASKTADSHLTYDPDADGPEPDVDETDAVE